MDKNKKKQRKFGWVDLVQWVLIAVILVSGGLFLRELMVYRQGSKTYADAQKEYVTPQATKAPEAQQPETTPLPPERDFELLDIDFEALQAKNPDVVAWIDFDALDISYPVVQGEDDQEYLYNLWDGRKNSAGSIFLEAENTGWDDLHTIVYGHNMKNGSMFGALKKYQDESFYRENGGWYTLYLPNGEIRRYEIFGAKIVKASASLYKIGFDFNDEYTDFLKDMCKGRLYNTGVAVYSEDRVMTLSTCTYSDALRMVTTARLAAVYTETDLVQ